LDLLRGEELNPVGQADPRHQLQQVPANDHGGKHADRNTDEQADGHTGY